MEIIAYKIVVFGIVQGVGFRYHTLRMAQQLNIRGFVRNEKNGSVYIEAEGEKQNLDEFIKWCKEGPGYASVTNVEIDIIDFVGHDSFNVKRN